MKQGIKTKLKVGTMAFLLFAVLSTRADAMVVDTLTVVVAGTMVDARFVPDRLTVQTGDVVRFDVREGIHTVTAYHPDNRRDIGIPEQANSFDSGPLTVGDIWFLQISVNGVYNYFCIPHESMGHTGQIIAE
ncbi:MAG: plastocyanin/azurin family copper-binding protein [Balneolaceae bacterium]